MQQVTGVNEAASPLVGPFTPAHWQRRVLVTVPLGGRAFEQVGGLLSGCHMVRECVVSASRRRRWAWLQEAGLLRLAAASPVGEVWPAGGGSRTPAERREACIPGVWAAAIPGLPDQLLARPATELGALA